MLADGESEVDNIVLRLLDYGVEIRNWTAFNFNRAFLAPTADWSFTIGNDDTTTARELLVEGAAVQLSINGAIQCTGFIEDVETDTSIDGGTVTTIKGGDILNQVVKATMDPAFKFNAGLTLPQFVLSVLDPFRIDVVSNSDEANIRTITGFAVGKGPATRQIDVQVPKDVTDANGVVTKEFTTVGRTEVVSSTRPDLAKLTLQQIKPRGGEGVYAYIDRMAKRLGFCMWATADGQGVVLDAPDYAQAARYSIIRSRSAPEQNNVKKAHQSRSRRQQPSIIVAFGFGGGKDVANTRLKCIMINELTGLDDQGRPLPDVQTIINRYKGAQLLPVRPEVVPMRKPLGDRQICVPLFLPDDESKTQEQLAAFVRREMARRQMASNQITYETIGFTQDGHAWAVNTQAAVHDEVIGVDETMWVHSVTFTKNPGGGTSSSIKVLPQHTLAIGS